MQTFLPYPSFTESAECLDYRRLGKQRVETMQIYNALSGKSRGWINHPAVKMWKGFEKELLIYGAVMCREFQARGYNDNMSSEFVMWLIDMDCMLEDIKHIAKNPQIPWLNEEFCASHKSNLIRKDPVFYGKYGWNVPNNLSYIWPVK